LKSSDEANEYKKILLKANWVDEKDIDTLTSSINNDDILVSTNRSLGLNFQIDETIKNIDLSNLVENINDVIETSREEIRNRRTS
jgi:hypothetical protein